VTRYLQRLFYYGYVIVFVAFFMQALGWFNRMSFGVFFNPFIDEFGWSRATISGTISVNFILYGVLCVLIGRLSDRFGPRAVMTVCSIILGLGCMLMSVVNEPYQMYLVFGVIVAVGMSGLDVVLLATIAKWFVKKRGTMTGLMKVGAGLGIFLLPPLAHWLISDYGWRTAYIIAGVVIIISLTSLAQLLKRDPAEMGVLPDGTGAINLDTNNNININNPNELALEAALRTKQFWILCAIAFMAMFCTELNLVHMVPHAIDMKVQPDTAAVILSTMGASSIVGRLLMGAVGDKIGSRTAMIIGFAVMTAAFGWLQFAGEPWMLFLFAFAQGFAHGSFFTLISPVVADLFGLKAQGAILGMIYFAGTAGGSIGPYMAGKLFDMNHTYMQSYLICLVFAFSATLMMTLLRNVSIKTNEAGARPFQA